jgi:Concanavalin A-like lectin/glucanases superfamily
MTWLTLAAVGVCCIAAFGDAADLRKAVTLCASFDEEVRADIGGGELNLSTRTGDPKKGPFTFDKGFDKSVFRIAKNKGKHGGALEVVDVLPNNGRTFFPATGNLAYRKTGWGGAVSMWISTDPNTHLKTPFCDPVQITQKGANNGGIWFDFNAAKPRRDLRMGAFPAVADGQKGFSEDDADAPMVRVPRVAFKADEWHHVVISWQNFDTGKPDAQATLYIDGKKIGSVKDRAIAMAWDVDRAGIYVAVNFIGLLDEFAVFGRPLTPDEVALLFREPGVLAIPK